MNGDPEPRECHPNPIWYSVKPQDAKKLSFLSCMGGNVVSELLKSEALLFEVDHRK